MSTFVQMMTPVMDNLAAIMISHGIDPESIKKDKRDDHIDYWIKFGTLVLNCVTSSDEPGMVSIYIEDTGHDEPNVAGTIEFYPIETEHRFLALEKPDLQHENLDWFMKLVHNLTQLEICVFCGRGNPITEIDLKTTLMILGLMAQAMVEYKATLED